MASSDDTISINNMHFPNGEIGTFAVSLKNCAIPPFEFENWVVIALGGIPNKVQVGDMGVDGSAN